MPKKTAVQDAPFDDIVKTAENAVNPLGLHRKLLEIRKKVKLLVKDGMNSHQNFKYVSSSQALNTLREHMDSYGLLLIPNCVRMDTEVVQTGKSPRVLTKINMIYTWMDVESKEEMACEWVAQGIDSNELGVGKAFTYAEKYFLMKFFNVPTDTDDPDHHAKETVSSDSHAKPPQSYKPAKTNQSTKPQESEKGPASEEKQQKMYDMLLALGGNNPDMVEQLLMNYTRFSVNGKEYFADDIQKLANKLKDGVPKWFYTTFSKIKKEYEEFKENNG